MTKLKIITGISICLAGVLVWQIWVHSHAAGTPHVKKYADVGFQIEVCEGPDFELSNGHEAVVMFRRERSSFMAEPDYLIKITVSRQSKEKLLSNAQRVSESKADDFNKWLAKNHTELDLMKDRLFWHLRKDILMTNGEMLSVDCDVKLHGAVETNLADAKCMIESIRPLAPH